MLNISSRQLRIFVSAAKHLNFTRAAEEVHISPPAVSMQIKEIELQVDAALFIKKGKKLQLSSAGEYFLNHARYILQTLNETEKVIQQLKGSKVEIIKVGIISTAQYFLPQVLKHFREEHSEYKIILEIRNREQLIGLLRDGKIDIAIMGLVPKEIDTKVYTITNHPHVFIANFDHKLVSQKKIQASALKDFDFISREKGSGTRAHMEAFMQDHDIQPNIIMEMSSNESIKQAVIAGLGISFVSQHTIAAELKTEQLKILNIIDTPINRKWHVVTLNPLSINRSVELLKDFILNHSETIIKKLLSQR
jgi:DNA-binding transcriptional LysR family regulator|tara:strand:+ start:1546 stop:2466 length:921 start_codon:yes stop_codon:yes gene_type:complete